MKLLPSLAVVCFGMVASTWNPGLGLADGAVDLEIVTEHGAPIHAAHDWLDALQGVGFSRIRIRNAGPGDRAEVVSGGTTALPSYRVTGILTRRSRLNLVGAEFGLRDGDRLTAWIERLQAGGRDGLTSAPMAFGLSPEELVRVHDSLVQPVGFPTQGQPVRRVVRKIAKRVDMEWTMDQAARKALASPIRIKDELENVSCGTGMASALRPLGLVLVPRVSKKKSSSRVVLTVIDESRATESWPVGWPEDRKARELAPQLFEFLDVDVQQQPLADVLEILQTRIEIPMLLDHNGLARHRVDPARALVSVPAGRSFYQRILTSVLVQTMLTSEIRRDEAGNPILWISSAKR